MKKIFYIILAIALLYFKGISFAQFMEEYCLVPPYVKKNVPPNIMVLMDNSLDMYYAAYSSNYDPTKTYVGYFKPNIYYKYTSQTFIECTGPSTDCKFYGNLMNWATMSRFDLLQKVLIGGRTVAKPPSGNIHTLGSLSGEWSKTYADCKFDISSGDLTISDSGGCALLGVGPVPTCPIPIGNCSIDTNFPCSTGNGNSKKNPSIISPTSPNLPYATQGQCYSFTFEAKWGNPEPTANYTWSIVSGSLPSGLSLDGPSGKIYGIPTVTGNFSFTIKVTDTTNKSDTKNVNLEVKAATVSPSASFKVRVDLPVEPLTDLNGNEIWDIGETYTDSNSNGVWDGKKGVIQEFWDENNPRARWGMTDFFQTDRVDVEACIPASPVSSFHTAIQNATPSDVSQLARGIYGVTHYFINSTNGRSEYDSDAYHGCTNTDPIDNTQCRLNFILMITSGTNLGGPKLPSKATTCAANVGTCLIDNARWAFINDIRNDKTGRQFISLYIVHTFGDSSSQAVLQQAAMSGGGNFYAADENNLEEQLRQALQDILRRAASGTAASVLASGEGQGANLIQAVFYPRTTTLERGGIFDREISWIGRLSNYWYYVDPLFATSTIFEDTDNNKKLSLSNDLTVRFRFDPTLETTFADLYSFGSTTLNSTLIFERVRVLWEAGFELWKRNLLIDPRTIYTSCVGGTCTNNLLSFSTGNATILRTYLQASSDSEAQDIINYIHGHEISGYRSRLVGIDLNGDGDATDSNEGPYVWKLGDILNSTPKVMSWIPLNSYDLKYNDESYREFTKSLGYKSRDTVFAGGNDGMLHAFKLGNLELSWSGQTDDEKARLTGTNIGRERWAFIPKHALPYLKYYADGGYCHIYSIDLTPYIFDASIGTTGCTEPNYWDCEKTTANALNRWKTILIGGMRFGGACRNRGSTCSDCVLTPLNNLGYSSYFAIDVTDENDPKLLWEFSHEDLGFTTTGPSIVRIGDAQKNGRWFVIFGSGPTGPIDTTNQQFLGRSDQNLKIFIIDLKNGPITNNFWIVDTGIQNAFSGSLLNAVIDTDRDYQDDVVYIPYVSKATVGTFTNGGILRLITLTTEDGEFKETNNVSNWSVTPVINNIGPVTSSVSNLQNKNTGKLWLYFGTGRYYFSIPNEIDDADSQRHIFGMTEPCYNNNWDSGCLGDATQRVRTFSQLTDVTDEPQGTNDPEGWYIKLDLSGNFTYCERINPDGTCFSDDYEITREYKAERIITDPHATTTGVVFFTAYKPYTDECTLGGKSFLWATKYDTGGAPGALLKGVGILQVSTGAIEQIKLAKAFVYAGGRKSYNLEGVPPMQQGLSIMTTPPPVKRIIHMRER